MSIKALNKVLQTLLVNPIVSEYDQDGWHIVKYANGRCEATIDTIVHATTEGTAVGGVYTAVARVDFPSGLFTSVPRAKPFSTFGNGVWCEAYANFMAYTIIALNRAAKIVTTWDIPVYLEVVGRWK